MSNKLPEGWKIYKLGDVATYVNGKVFKPSEWSERGTPIVRIQNLTDKSKPYNYYAKDDIPEKYVINNGDILISWSASLGVFEWNNGYAFLNQHIFKVIFDKIDINKKYFVYIVRAKLSEMGRHTHGSTMKHITKGNFDNIPINLPPLEEQERIVYILEKAEKAIQKREESTRLLDELVKSKFNEMFGEPIKNTKGWNWSKLEELGNWKTGGTPSRRKMEYFKGKIPWLSSGELNNKYCFDSNEHITEEAISNSSAKLIEKESLLLGMYDTAALKSTINMVECTCNQAIAYSKLSSELVNTIYVYYCIQIGKEFYKRQQRGVRQKNLNLSMIKELEIIMPPIELQNQFADFVKQVDKLKFKMESSLKELENNFNSLMQKAFNGEL